MLVIGGVDGESVDGVNARRFRYCDVNLELVTRVTDELLRLNLGPQHHRRAVLTDTANDSRCGQRSGSVGYLKETQDRRSGVS